jgi:chaperonin cofactor prefoldin
MNARTIEFAKTIAPEWLKKINDITNAYQDLIVTQPDLRTEFQKNVDAAQEFIDKYGEAINGALAVGSQFNQMQTAEVTAEYDKQKEALDAKFAAGRLSREKYDQELKKLDLKREKEQKAINKRQQKIDIAQAVVNTGVAITSALGTKPFFPLGLIMAGLAGTMGALQIATIKAQKFATGGFVKGAGTETSDSIPAMLSKNEWVGSAQTVKAFPNTIQAMEYTQRTGNMSNIAAAAARDSGGGTQIIQPKVTATLGVNGRDLAFMVQSELNDYSRSGGNIDGL